MSRFLGIFKVPPTEEWPRKRLVASYALDWVIIVLFAAVGGGLSFTSPERRPFSLVDLAISYPLHSQTVSVGVLALAALAGPAVIIAIVCLLVVPGTSGGRSFKSTRAWRRKLWEGFASITGLALSIAVAFFITQGLKIVFGKPRPHLLAVCDPDLTNIASHVVGGSISPYKLVTSSICRTKDLKELKDSFQSFPSGHCSFSWSGLLYLSLFLCAKFSISIPYLPLEPMAPLRSSMQLSPDTELLPLHRHAASSSEASTTKDSPPPFQTSASQSQSTAPIQLYNQGAAPPVYGILLVLIPVSVAAWIASTRYTNYYHDGFDVISGSIIGIATAILSFRWYHLPLHRGQGWAWRSRTYDRAFGVGMGVKSYVGANP